MKFAKTLIRNEVPEWAQFYIDYKALKKLVNVAASELSIAAKREDPNRPHTVSETFDDKITAPFFYAMDRNVERVDNFYNSKYAEYTRRLRHVEQQCSLIFQQLNQDETEESEKEEMTAMLLELRSHLRNLQWYAEVNKRGFTKILKKFDKKVGTRAKSHYLSSRILILGFSHGIEVTEKVDAISRLLRDIAPHIRHQSPPLQSRTNSYMGSQIQSGHPGEIGTVSLTRTTSDLSMPHSPLGMLRIAVENNEAKEVIDTLSTLTLNAKQVISLILRAVSVHAIDVIPILAERYAVQLVDGTSDINRRNIVHKAIINEGRSMADLKSASKMEIGIGVPGRATSDNATSGNYRVKEELADSDNELVDQKGAESLRVLVEALSRRVPIDAFIMAVDLQLRTPVHYSARYGLSATMSMLLELDVATLKFSDADGATPLDLAVLNKQPRTLSRILEYSPVKVPELLLTAARLDASAVIDVLIEEGKYDVNFQNGNSPTGETALHVAAKYNNINSVRLLIKHGADVEIKESTFEWTPIFFAAVDGSEEIAQALLDAGAKADVLDNSGWTAKEHAALRGHLDLARKLPSPPASPPRPLAMSQSLDKRRTADNTVLKTFGHRYLENEQEVLVLVTLGSRDLRKNTQPVQLEKLPMSEAGKTQLDTALTLVVSAVNATGEPYQVDLPVSALDLSTEPIPFFTTEFPNMMLVFDLVPTYSAGSNSLARGVYMPPPLSLMTNLNKSVQTVSIIESNSLQILGQVHFEYLIVKPFVHPAVGLDVSATYWRSLITTRVIGHRGLGKNTLQKSSLQLGENTVESFIQAANLGASYVEFDVQLTKDNVPVIYHDFLVGDSGFDIPMHAMTLDQFMNIQRPVRGRHERKSEDDMINHHGGFRGNGASDDSMQVKSSDGVHKGGESFKNLYDGLSSENSIPVVPSMSPSEKYGSILPNVKPKRSRSVHQFNSSEDADISYDDAVRRMRYTRDFQTKGFKGNVRGLHIQSKFATLDELFRTLPTGLGFNIEFKYPMQDEAESEEMDGTVFEINHFVDSILKVIYDHKKERDVILSSFNPDVCILLSLKQPSIPILFLTEAGTEKMYDIRASSLQEAIRFARRFNLLGIVSGASPLIMCPRLVRAVKESGLVCFTYGTDNNVPENARIQLKAGVDAVIVDSVLAIRKELTDATSQNSDDILVREVTSALDKAKIT